MKNYNMSHKVVVPPKVEKEINSLPDKLFDNITNHILRLSQNPFPNSSIKLKNTLGYRIRVGDYRIVFDVDIKNKLVIIQRVAHRKDVYKGK